MWRALVVLAACWTGSTQPAQPAQEASEVPSGFEITLERTPCFGSCPVYSVSIDGDGRVRWRGGAHVVATGERRATVPRKRIAEIQRVLDDVQFFRRDERGEPACERSGKTSTCSFGSVTICSDSSLAIITVRRKDQTHKVSNDHCDPSPLDELEALIDDIARTSAWIGERVLSQ